uniref:Uncharacterized protein n=1 Tax=Tetranychus urticae TaxID=32264 RepID=T1L4I5_TETUR
MYRFLYPPGEESSLILASNFKVNMKLKSGAIFTNGPYLAFPCLTDGKPDQPSMYDILCKAGIYLTPRPFDSTETGIYLIHGVTKKTIKRE